jgi:pimeloyl-ACP methyl ester carboxylesterase
VSNFFTPEFNNESAIGPWNASLEPTKAIIPQLDANRVLTGGVGQEVNIPTLTPEAYDNIILPDDLLTRMASAVSTDSNSSLPDSSVDLLTGQGMSEVYGDLSKFAAGPDFVAKMNLAFGENWDAAGAKALAEGWFHGDFSDIPPVKVVSSAEIAGANGAFAAATDTIYLSKEFLDRNAANSAAVADVLLEEIGHSVDARLNVTDALGDEGAIFGAVVQGKELSEGELQGLKSEDDSGTVLFNGQTISIERASSFDIGNRWYVQAFDGSGKPINNYDFGSNTLNDGKKGFAGDWGARSPRSGIPNDNFALAFWTQADFQQGQTYNFKVRADDSYALAALPVGAQNSNQWEFITEWKWNEDAYGGKTVQFIPKNSGKYWVLEYYRERDGNAYFDTSWEKVSNPISGSGTATKGSESKTIEFKPVDRPLSDIANRPTWLIIHGFDNNSTDDKTIYLANAIGDYQEGDQVLILDWGSAAKDTKSYQTATSWIESVADAAKKKLRDEWGIASDNINLVGHSLGSYVAWETAKKIGEVNKLIALDPATNTLGYVGGEYKEGDVNFSNYSKWSWGFYGSLLGAGKIANTAEESFEFMFPNGFGGLNPQVAEEQKHGAVVYAFADIVKENKKQPGYFTSLLDLDNMNKNSSDAQPWKRDNGFEATLAVNQNNNKWVISDSESRVGTDFGNALIAS